MGSMVRVGLDFVRREAISATFSLVLLAAIALTDAVRVPGIARYDLLLVVGVVTQVVMVWRKMETWLDVLVMALYHGLGLLLETYKVNHGSWSYPEAALTKIGNVPLYSGFMYASVASYMSVAYRVFRLEFGGWPGKWWSGLALVLVYGQFFLPAQNLAIRAALAGVIVAVYWRCWVHFDAGGVRLKMPLNVSFGLIGFFVWVAENWATHFHGWVYPNQLDGWEPVQFSKVLSWSLMVVVSVNILYAYKETIKGKVKSARP
jgi:uncharacterized membrane protein YoaT (DUF817 family)